MSDITNSDFFEVILRQAVIQNNKNEIAEIPFDDELKKLYTFSERHNQRMKKLFAADKRREVFTSIYKWSKIAIIITCVSATLSFGMLLTFAEVRESISDVILTWFEKFTKFQSAVVSEEFVEREWSLGYLPDGFKSEYDNKFGDIRDIEYKNSDNLRITFSYMPSDSSVSVDNEDMEYNIMIDNDILYHLFKATITDGYHDNIIVWNMNGYRFNIAGNYNIDELIKIAISVK